MKTSRLRVRSGTFFFLTRSIGARFDFVIAPRGRLRNSAGERGSKKTTFAELTFKEGQQLQVASKSKRQLDNDAVALNALATNSFSVRGAVNGLPIRESPLARPLFQSPTLHLHPALGTLHSAPKKAPHCWKAQRNRGAGIRSEGASRPRRASTPKAAQLHPGHPNKTSNHEIGAPGFEPGTFCSQSRRATGLRHTPLDRQRN